MRLSRRQFLKLGARAGMALAVAPIGCRWTRSLHSPSTDLWVNDVHSQLNRTRVREVIRPGSLEELVEVVRRTAKRGGSLSIAGGRHAAGGQQFLTDGVLVDMRGLNRVTSLDTKNGVANAEAGILWPDLMDDLARRQAGASSAWGIVQKQGMDRMTLGGSLAANIHGNGLGLQPFSAQVESVELLNSSGTIQTCSRTENPELFSFVAGGYGLFGVVASMKLRLAPRKKLRAQAQMADAADVTALFAQRQAEGCLYGDWHYSPDTDAKDFLRRGVMVTYRPLDERDDTPVNDTVLFSSDDWLRLVTLAHVKRGEAFSRYAEDALRQNGNVVWSDTFQLDRAYVDNYHAAVDKELHARMPGSESLVEFFVPRKELAAFLDDVRTDFLRHDVALLYGTVRVAERDTDSYLAWAREPCACVVFNFHVVHDDAGRRALADTFRRVVDIAVQYGGTFYLTYHRFATRLQVERCYPQFPEFLHAKRRYDPSEVFQSDWYRYYKTMFANMA